jgi:inosine-uridine nucleoside N-ribohydrolase
MKRTLTLAALLAVAGVANAAPAPETVVFDTDSAYFNDDGSALVMLLRRPEAVKIAALTVVAGNYAPLQGAEYMARVLELMERPDIPIYIGADAPLRNDRTMAAKMTAEWGLGFKGALGRAPVKTLADRTPPSGGKFAAVRPRPEPGVEALIALVEASTRPVTLLALGPMTNIALALRRKPGLAAKIGRLVFMGGAARVPGNVTPHAEFNFWFDPEAADAVLSSPIREKVMIGLDLTNQALLDKSHFDQIASTRTPIAALFREDMGERGPKFLSDPKATRFVWDALAAAYLLDPAIATKSENLDLSVETEFGPRYGAVIVGRSRKHSRVRVLTGLDFPRFFALFKDALAAP